MEGPLRPREGDGAAAPAIADAERDLIAREGNARIGRLVGRQRVGVLRQIDGLAGPSGRLIPGECQSQESALSARIPVTALYILAS